MERRKGIPLVALVIFVALLVAIILTCVIILGANKKNKGNNQNQIATPDASNETQTSPEPVEDEEGTVIENEDIMNADSDIAEAYKIAGNGKTFAKYAIYSSGGFDTERNNLKNDLKLQLAMAQVTNSDMDKTSTTKSVPKEKVQEYASKILEENESIEYKDFSLYSSDTNFTEAYKTVGYVYNEEKDAYDVQENDVTEDTPSEITEVITKVVKYNSKIEIYVKPLFIQTFYSTEINGMGCEIFGDYNFQAKEYEDSFIAIAYSDYDGILKSEYNKDLDKYKYEEVASNIDLNQITEYKYTFTKSDDGYKIKSFGIAKDSSEQTQINNTEKQMTQQEIDIFNADINEYVGSNKQASDVEMILDTIISKNTLYEEQPENIVEVKLDNESIKLEDEDVKKLNEDIEELKNKIDTDGEYTIKATYSSGKINAITITKQ